MSDDTRALAGDSPYTETELLRYITDTPALLDLLYDTALLPEETGGSADYQRTLMIAAHHKRAAALLAADRQAREAELCRMCGLYERELEYAAKLMGERDVARAEAVEQTQAAYQMQAERDMTTAECERLRGRVYYWLRRAARNFAEKLALEAECERLRGIVTEQEIAINNGKHRDLMLARAERDLAEVREACPCVAMQDHFGDTPLQAVQYTVSRLISTGVEADRLRAEVERLKERERELTDLQFRWDRRERDMDRLRAEVERLSDERNGLRGEVNNYAAERARLRADVERLREAAIRLALPCEALLADVESSKWITASIWRAMETETRALRETLEEAEQ
jgi:hypothetical protein